MAAARANVRHAEEGAEAREDSSTVRISRPWRTTLGASDSKTWRVRAFSLNLPLVHPRRLDERRAEMEANLSAARAALESVRGEIRRGIEEAAADLGRDVEQEKLYRTSILPQAEVNYRSAEESYSVGKIDFRDFRAGCIGSRLLRDRARPRLRDRPRRRGASKGLGTAPDRRNAGAGRNSMRRIR